MEGSRRPMCPSVGYSAAEAIRGERRSERRGTISFMAHVVTGFAEAAQESRWSCTSTLEVAETEGLVGKIGGPADARFVDDDRRLDLGRGDHLDVDAAVAERFEKT